MKTKNLAQELEPVAKDIRLEPRTEGLASSNAEPGLIDPTNGKAERFIKIGTGHMLASISCNQSAEQG